MSRSTHQAILRQLVYAFVGCCGAGLIYSLGYHRLMRYSGPLIAFFSLLLLLTLIPGIGRVVNGSRRWLSIGGVSLQPSEFAKYAIPLFYIHRVTQWKTFSFKPFMRLVALLAVPIFLILVEPNNGTAAVIVMTLGVLFGLTHIPLKYWMVPVLAFALVGAIFAFRLPYVTQRLKVYLDPTHDIQGRGHQPYQAKIAAGSGQVWGKGPGKSFQKLSYLPEAQNDYIVAIYAEEYGYVGMLLLITLYMALACIGFSIAYRAPDTPGMLLGSTVTFLICFQAFLNMGVVSGLLPSTGLNLPFFSQGGTSLVANIMGISFLWAISSRQSDLTKISFS